MNIKGKNIFVTGGSKRVGKAIALLLASHEANIWFSYHSDTKSARDTKDELEALGVRAHAIQLDLSDRDTYEPLIADLLHEGEFFGLVNNAAIFYRTPIADLTRQQYDAFLETNLNGPFWLAVCFGRHMQAGNGGRIVNIADVAAERIWPNYIPYGIAKSGLVASTVGLAKALAPHVLVNTVSPGTVLLAESYDAEEEQALIDKTPLKRVGKPEDIAKAVLFLINDNEFITGQNIGVDGGRSLV
jgi:NAD(P)-dependent dehydrogenase (short-subunit alcohol dehydrogenase family)